MEQTVENPVVTAPAVPPPMAPVPMSFPALLINPKSRVAQLRSKEGRTVSKTVEITGKGQGKRWVRRAENSVFGGNPHIVKPTRGDYDLPPVELKATFPKPLPPYLPRVSSAPSPVRKIDVPSSQAGRFSLSLRGVRKELRQRGRRANELVQDVEDSMKGWLDGATSITADPVTRPIDRGDHPSIMELSRTPVQLEWRTTDPFARYIVHCVARWHSVVSFSKDVTTANGAVERHTFLLRPNTRYPDPRAAAMLHTPTTTDVDYSSPAFESESELGDLANSVASLNLASGVLVPHEPAVLSAPVVDAIPADNEASDHDGYSSESSFAIVDGDGEIQDSNRKKEEDAAPLSLRPRERSTLTRVPGFTPTHLRSGSSPSRSPVRQRRPRPTRRGMAMPIPALPTFKPPREPTISFWDFIYA